MRFALMIAAATMAIAAGTPVSAKEYRVAMVNRSSEGAMAFAPGYLRVAPGDTVRFVPQDPGHNAESIVPMTPAGAPPFKGGINQALVVKFTRPGLYGYKCFPHLGLGMVGLIQVGKPTNLVEATAEASKLPPFAKKRMNAYLAQVR